MLFAKIISKRHIRGVQKIFKETSEWKKEIESGRLPSNKKTYTTQELSEHIKKLEVMLLKEIKHSKNDERSVNIIVDRLIDEMKQALMLPFSTLFFALPKTVHDMAISIGKEAVLKVEGGEIEIDRRILQEMKDPITHLLRNAIDHGIETPEVRAKKQKPNKGLITISLKQESSSKVSIIVCDDGEGIDKNRLIDLALKNGIIDKEESKNLDSKTILSLIFKSGLTTRKIVNDLSGRGLGLAIVKEKTERLGGKISVKNLDEGGTEFKIALPLTLSTFRGVLVGVDEHRFIFPSINVKRVMKILSEEIKTIEGKETFTFNHQIIPFVLLRDLLNIQGKIDENKKITVAIVESGEDLISVGVDEILYEEEVMIKSLGKQLSRVKNISGVALLSSDKPALILNIQDLFKSIRIARSSAVSVHKDEVYKKRRVMVVDDSPTTRILLKNVLEIAGYDVVSAIDGLEAYTELKKSAFDLLVSDIEMPNMNGFELTESVRSDKMLSELPIVLVTALDSAEDKQRGMKAGANAYIVKSSFDQNNLMETIKWLIS
jgi:two-component system chemotaxis sensor kinase CheA